MFDQILLRPLHQATRLCVRAPCLCVCVCVCINTATNFDLLVHKITISPVPLFFEQVRHHHHLMWQPSSPDTWLMKTTDIQNRAVWLLRLIKRSRLGLLRVGNIKKSSGGGGGRGGVDNWPSPIGAHLHRHMKGQVSVISVLNNHRSGT